MFEIFFSQKPWSWIGRTAERPFQLHEDNQNQCTDAIKRNIISKDPILIEGVAGVRNIIQDVALSNQIKQIINKCLKKIASERITAHEIKELLMNVENQDTSIEAVKLVI